MEKRKGEIAGLGVLKELDQFGVYLAGYGLVDADEEGHGFLDRVPQLLFVHGVLSPIGYNWMYHIDYSEEMSIRKREGGEMDKQEDSKEDKEKETLWHDTGRRNIAGQPILHPVRE